MRMTVSLCSGVVVADRFRLLKQLGAGGMGQVWEATNEYTGDTRALKFLNEPVHVDTPEGRRFLREARAAAMVRHPNVVRVDDFFPDKSGTPIMVMERLRGTTLAAELKERKKLPLAEVAALLLPVVSAVGTAHSRGVIHRDLKPENIFLCECESPSDGVPVRVLDFGIAKLVGASKGAKDAEALTGAKGIVGTLHYMSPEQATVGGHVDHRSDVWALGALLYEMLSGGRPVDGRDPAEVHVRLLSAAITPIDSLMRGLPDDVCELIGRMLSRPCEDRPSDLREVAEVLARYSDRVVPCFGAAIEELEAVESSPMGVSPPVATLALSTTDPVGAAAVAEPRAVPRPTTTDMGVADERQRRWFVLSAAAIAVLALVAITSAARQRGEWSPGPSEPIPVTPVGGGLEQTTGPPPPVVSSATREESAPPPRTPPRQGPPKRRLPKGPRVLAATSQSSGGIHSAPSDL